MLSKNSKILEVRSWIHWCMGAYFEHSIKNKDSNSIILPVEDLFAMSEETKSYKEVLITETIQAIEKQFTGLKIKRDKEIDEKLVYYGLLYSGLCYVIQFGEFVNKEIYTLSAEELYKGYNNNLLVGKTIDEDVSLKVGKIIYNISEGKRLLKTLIKDRDYTPGVFTVRLDKAYQIEEDMRMHYTPVTPNGTMRLDNTVIIPYEAYNWVQERLYQYSQIGILCVIEENRTSLVSSSPVILGKVYSETRAKELYTTIQREDSIILPEVGASIYTKGTRTFYIENIDRVVDLTVEQTMSVMNRKPVTVEGVTYSFDLIGVDVRGAKDFLEEKLDYENLDTEKKKVVNAYTDEKAYRYLKNKKVEFKSYSEKFGNLNKRISIPATEEELKQLLWTGVFEIELLTKKGKSKIICTANQEIIEEVYGEDYRIYCNALNSRIREFYYKLRNALNRQDEILVHKLLTRDIFVKFGITYSMLNLDGDETTISKVIKALETKIGEIKESTQSDRQILVTSLTDSKPKDGYGRNLTRSFYFDNVLSIVKLK